MSSLTALFPRILATTGNVSLRRNEGRPLRYAVVIGAVPGEVLDTFDDVADAEEYYETACDRVCTGREWPDPDAPSVATICPAFIAHYLKAKFGR